MCGSLIVQWRHTYCCSAKYILNRSAFLTSVMWSCEQRGGIWAAALRLASLGRQFARVCPHYAVAVVIKRTASLALGAAHYVSPTNFYRLLNSWGRCIDRSIINCYGLGPKSVLFITIPFFVTSFNQNQEGCTNTQNLYQLDMYMSF